MPLTAKVMKHFVDWYRENSVASERPWLILGKGPSFSDAKQHDLSKYSLLTLNHAARELNTDVAHVIDVEVLQVCGSAIEKNANFLVMPFVPHFALSAVAGKTLADWISQIPILAKFEAEERLLWYDLSTGGTVCGPYPVVEAYNFSSEAALGLLGLAGAKVIHSLGIDGGGNYACEFADLVGSSCLANGQVSFDSQFKEFPKIINKYGVSYSPLSGQYPIRVFVGASESEWLPARVLEYSVQKNCSVAVDCFPLYRSDLEIPQAQHERSRTPFSFQRFLIPQLMNYSGRAIYLDSDMLVLHDLQRLWQMPFDGADLVCVRGLNEQQRAVRFSVMLLNCAALGWKIEEIIDGLDRGAYTYNELVYEMCIAKHAAARIPPTWNALDRFVAGTTGLLHYTNMTTQPWLSAEHSYAGIWFEYLFEALDRGFISMSDISEQVNRGNVRPSLLSQCEKRFSEPSRLSDAERSADDNFVLPGMLHLQAKHSTTV